MQVPPVCRASCSQRSRCMRCQRNTASGSAPSHTQDGGTPPERELPAASRRSQLIHRSSESPSSDRQPPCQAKPPSLGQRCGRRVPPPTCKPLPQWPQTTIPASSGCPQPPDSSSAEPGSALLRRSGDSTHSCSPPRAAELSRLRKVPSLVVPRLAHEAGTSRRWPLAVSPSSRTEPPRESDRTSLTSSTWPSNGCPEREGDLIPRGSDGPERFRRNEDAGPGPTRVKLRNRATRIRREVQRPAVPPSAR